MKNKKLILILFMFIILQNITLGNDILFFKDTFSKNQSLTIDYIMNPNSKESILNSSVLFYSDNTYYTGKNSASISNPTITTNGGYQIYNTPLDSVGYIIFDFGENITILNNSYFIFNSTGFNYDATSTPSHLHIVFDRDDDSLTQVYSFYLDTNNNNFINMSFLNGNKFRFMRISLGSTNSFSNYHNLNNLELYNFLRPFNENNILPYFDSITPLNRNIELCDDSVFFNYTINAIDDEDNIIYYSSSVPLLYNQNIAINSYFTNYDNSVCSFDNSFISNYIDIDEYGYLRKGLINSLECKGYIQGFDNLTFDYGTGLTENSTFIIELNYLNGLFSNNDNNVSLCFLEDSNQLIECLEFYKTGNDILIYNSNNTLIATLENFKANSLFLNSHDFYKNTSQINMEFIYINSSNNVAYAYYNFTKEFNNIASFKIETKDFSRFLSEDLQIKRIGFYGTDVIPILDFDLEKERSIEFFRLGSQSFTNYVTDEQGLYLNEYNELTTYINVVPCGSLLTPLNETQQYNGQTLNIFDGLNEFKVMIKLFFTSLDSVFGIENNFFTIYWAFKTLSFIIIIALCIAISSLFIQFGTKITYLIFSVFLTLCYFFNTLLIEYSINFTMIIILNMVIALIQFVALKGGDTVNG